MTEIGDIVEHGVVEIPENTAELYKILAKCNLVEFFPKFMEEELNDDSLPILNSDKECFWKIIPKIVQKAGAQLRVYNEITQFNKNSEGVGQNMQKDEYYDQTQKYYNAFNETIVSTFFLFRNKILRLQLVTCGLGKWNCCIPFHRFSFIFFRFNLISSKV